MLILPLKLSSPSSTNPNSPFSLLLTSHPPARPPPQPPPKLSSPSSSNLQPPRPPAKPPDLVTDLFPCSIPCSWSLVVLASSFILVLSLSPSPSPSATSVGLCSSRDLATSSAFSSQGKPDLTLDCSSGPCAIFFGKSFGLSISSPLCLLIGASYNLILVLEWLRGNLVLAGHLCERFASWPSIVLLLLSVLASRYLLCSLIFESKFSGPVGLQIPGEYGLSVSSPTPTLWDLFFLL